MTSFLLLTLFSCHADIVSSLFHPYFTAAFASKIFATCSIGQNCVPNSNDLLNWLLCLQYGLREFLVEMVPLAVLWIQEIPQ